MSEFDEDEREPDRPLTAEEEARASLLTAADLQLIDGLLLAEASRSWRKTARVVGSTMSAIHNEFLGLPDVFYARRIKHLVRAGELEAAGSLDRMRFSEVRIPGPRADSL